MLLGYPLATKGYKLLNLSSRQFFISRDVVFQEHIFPFISHKPFSSSTPSKVFHSFVPNYTSTLTFPFLDSSVYHDSFFHDQHFVLDLDSVSDDDLASPSQSVSVQDDQHADHSIPTAPISAPRISLDVSSAPQPNS